MKKLLLAIIFIFILDFSYVSSASATELKKCIEISHCAMEEWNVENISNPFEEIKKIIETSPRVKITELKEDYIHAEATSRIMKYVDDLEILLAPERSKMIVRSESRVGEGDFGVNRKRIEKLKLALYK